MRPPRRYTLRNPCAQDKLDIDTVTFVVLPSGRVALEMTVVAGVARLGLPGDCSVVQARVRYRELLAEGYTPVPEATT